MSITALLCTRLQINVVSVYCEAHYLTICIGHFASNAQTTVNSFTQLVIVVIKYYVVGLLPRSI
jgi:hypothetical protein